VAAESNIPVETPFSINFVNALNYTGESKMANVSLADFNEAMQYIIIPDDKLIERRAIIAAAARCSLVHAVYEVIAEGTTYDELAPLAILDGGFKDMYKGGPNENMTWCFRARRYGHPTIEKEKRSGSRARSMQTEKQALKALTDLLILFGGKVHLQEPDCKIYIFDGFDTSKKVLARRISTSPRVRDTLFSCFYLSIAQPCFIVVAHPLFVNNAFTTDILDCSQYTDLYYKYTSRADCRLFVMQRCPG
jgi:hypothetical protein